MTELKQLTILLVEDEAELRQETAAFLRLYYERVIPAANGSQALTLFAEHKPNLVISDIRMPAMDGLELAGRLKGLAPETPLIFCTAFTETAYLLKAIELGVSAFIRKPIDADELLTAIGKAVEPVLQRREISGLSAELAASLQGPMRAVPAQLAVTEQALRVARTSFTVLLEGETGSGKSRLASIIHNLSPRRKNPFVTIQLGALPQQLAESELFGHVKGAFTGADRTKTGLVESATGGTLFLDDIESCAPPLQAKLLRFAEEKRFTPVGSTTEKSVDIRIIAASNHDLRQEVLAGRFREDLYYRLADVTITLPPLRKMPEAVVPLAKKFLHETCDELGRDLPLLDEEAGALLSRSPWTGNIRQLKSVIRRVALNAGSIVSQDDITAAMDCRTPVQQAGSNDAATSPPPFPCSMDRLERWSLEQALRFCGGKRMKTAMMLGMNYYTFRRRLEKHGISTDEE
jgi:DNA-binding NtrC family response regulator